MSTISPVQINKRSETMNKLIDLLLLIETLSDEELKSLSAWIDFNLYKREHMEGDNE